MYYRSCRACPTCNLQQLPQGIEPISFVSPPAFPQTESLVGASQPDADHALIIERFRGPLLMDLAVPIDTALAAHFSERSLGLSNGAVRPQCRIVGWLDSGVFPNQVTRAKRSRC